MTEAQGGVENLEPASQRRDTVFVALFCLLAVIGYFWASTPFTGPAYLADEVGYLSNAAFIAGHTSHGGSSYYAGYSLIIAPLFLLFADASQVWTGILALNALMWGLTLFLISGLLERLRPGTPLWKRLLVLSVMASYPAYVAMSGYAFSQSAVAVLFATSLVTLLRLRTDRPLSVVPHATLVGYLCCVHPVGFAVAMASILVLAALSFRTRRWGVFLIAVTVIGGMAAAYHMAINPWLVAEMTAPGTKAGLHYPSARQLFKVEHLRQQLLVLFGMFFGQLCYIVLATFGFVGLGLVAVAQEGLRAYRQADRDAGALPTAAILLIIWLSLLGIIGESALASALTAGPNRMDQWIYGRYLEPIMAFLLGFGLLSPARKGWVFGWALLTVLVGVLLVHIIGMSGDLYVMNVPALWPSSAKLANEPMAWFLFGAGGIVVAAALNRTLVMLLMIGVYLWCMPEHHAWHSRILKLNSNPSDLPDFVEANYAPGQCVGFDVSSSASLPVNRQERANLYSFYLFDSPLLRMTPAQWLAQCDGPLLTFDGALKLPNTHYVGREKISKLYVLVKNRPEPLIFPHVEPNEQEWLDAADSERCLVAGCFEKQGEQFASHRTVGTVSAEGIATDGRAGYLSFGPYAFLSAGNYLLELEGEFQQVEGVRIDVASAAEPIPYTDVALKPYLDAQGRVARIPFELPDDMPRVEVRIRVSAQDNLRLWRYRVVINDTPLRSQPGPALSFQGGQLMELSHQVGQPSKGGIVSDGRDGFLLYGPYKKVHAGRYTLEMQGTSATADDAWIDIVSDAGRKLHFRARIPSYRKGELIEPAQIELPDVENLEIRVHVGADDQVEVTAYSLSKPSR